VLEGGSECEDMVSSSGEVSSGEEQSSERDELMSARSRSKDWWRMDGEVD
jgi:hypothetical protein